MNNNVDLITYNDTPNFSVVVPANCEASCSFCFDKGGGFNLEFDGWYKTLELFIDKLPSRFQQVSVTGGEPTALEVPQLLKLMELLKRNFKKIVVTTNGLNLSKNIGSLALADFVNISYHGVNKKESDETFHGNVSPEKYELAKSVRQLKALGTKVRLQRVVVTPPDLDNVFAYVDFAKSVGVEDVAFRMNIENEVSLKESWLPISPLKAVHTASCPVCADWTYLVDGCTVHFKGGKAETNTKVPYELIFNRQGKLTTTWGKVTIPKWVKIDSPEKYIKKIVEDIIQKKPSKLAEGQVRGGSIRTGCGSGTGGCGGLGAIRCASTSCGSSGGCGSSGTSRITRSVSTSCGGSGCG